MSGKADDGGRRKHVGVDYVAAVIGHEANGGADDPVVPAKLFQLVSLLVEFFPALVVGEHGDAHGSFWQGLPVLKIVGRADDATAHVTEFVRSLPVKSIPVVEESDGPIVTQVDRFAVESGDRFAEAQSTGASVIDRLSIVAHAHRLAPASGGEHTFGLEDLAPFEDDAGDSAVLHFQAFHAAAEAQFTAQFSELADQQSEDEANSSERSAESFEKDAAEHDGELPPIHIVFPGRTIEHDVGQKSISISSGSVIISATRAVGLRWIDSSSVQVVVFDDWPARVAGETLSHLGGKFTCEYRLLQQIQVIVESLTSYTWKHDVGTQLRARSPGHRSVMPQLPQQPGKRALAFTPSGVTLVTACNPTS